MMRSAPLTGGPGELRSFEEVHRHLGHAMPERRTCCRMDCSMEVVDPSK